MEAPRRAGRARSHPQPANPAAGVAPSGRGAAASLRACRRARWQRARPVADEATPSNYLWMSTAKRERPTQERESGQHADRLDTPVRWTKASGKAKPVGKKVVFITGTG
eukprot:3318181-Prymnesium_polylepis.1